MPPSPSPKAAKRFLLLLILPLLLPAVAALGADFSSIQEAFGAVQARWQRIGAYTCLYASHSLVPKERNLTARYAFAKPSFIRMEIIGGASAGTTLLWDGGPKVRVRKKGLLSLFPLSLDLRNPKLVDPFDEDLSNSSWKFLIELGGRALKDGRLELESRGGAGPFVLVHQYTPGSSPFSKDRVFVDRASLMPERVERYDASGALIEEITYRDIQLDPVLPANLFKEF